MRVLLIGSGGREHAIAWKLAQSPRLTKLYIAPGNAGMASCGTCVAIDLTDHAALIALCRDEAIDLAFVGPEAPLVAGLVDAFKAAGIASFGPSAAAAALEGSKAFTKSLCDACAIPTARYQVFDQVDAAKAYVRDQGTPIVIKADGLAAGKGVTVAQTQTEAFAAIEALAAQGDETSGAGDLNIVIEECLTGPEASFFALVDALTVLPFGTAQDHKRAFDGDAGPNTGGMGAFSPAQVLSPALEEEILAKIIRPTARGMVERGTPFRGILYAGLMITSDGPKLIEYNVRLGDPETQVLMLRLQSDLLELLAGAATGRLGDLTATWRDEAAVTVVIASNGYPGSYAKNVVIPELSAITPDENSALFHAGTALSGGEIVATGGRVLNASATGADLSSAAAAAYDLVEGINWQGGFYRSDIAASAPSPKAD